MSRHWNRREMLQSLSLGVIAGSELLAATAKAAVAPALAKCTVLNHRGEPLKPEEFARFHTCDLLTRPFTIDPKFEPGTAAFQPPERPFRIALPMTVPGFGEVFVYADNRGRGYTAQSFSDKPLQLNYEFAADRLATAHRISEEAQRSGLTISAAARERVEKAEALLKKAEGMAEDKAERIATLMSSLCESLWAGEMLVVERAEQMILRNGPRPGFLFGCQAFGYGRGRPRRGQAAEDAEKSDERRKKYIEHFDAAFNFATVPFYPRTDGARAGQAGLFGCRGRPRSPRPHRHHGQGPSPHFPRAGRHAQLAPQPVVRRNQETLHGAHPPVDPAVPQPHPHLGRDQRGPRATGQ